MSLAFLLGNLEIMDILAETVNNTFHGVNGSPVSPFPANSSIAGFSMQESVGESRGPTQGGGEEEEDNDSFSTMNPLEISDLSSSFKGSQTTHSLHHLSISVDQTTNEEEEESLSHHRRHFFPFNRSTTAATATTTRQNYYYHNSSSYKKLLPKKIRKAAKRIAHLFGPAAAPIPPPPPSSSSSTEVSK
jgi:hypothetical protein